MAVELATAYVSVVPSVKGIKGSLAKAMSGADSEASKAGKAAGGKFSGAFKVAAGAAVAAGAVAAAGFVKAMNVEAVNDKLSASLGLTKKQSKRAGKAAGSLYSKAYGESIGEVSGATEAVMSSMKGMRNASAPEIEAMTKNVLNMASAFEIDTARAAQVAGQMITTGLAKDGKHAADLLTASLQAVPKAVREDVLDAVDEYGPFMEQVGISGEKAMGMLVNASKKGMYGIDKTGDAVKEFGIRATDMSKLTGEAYDTLGMDQGAMTEKLLKGGETGSKAFQKIVTGLQGVKDPAARSQAAIALFGTPLEDLSVNEIPKFLGSLTGAKGGLKDVAGASKDLDKQLNDNAKTAITEFGRTMQAKFVKILGEKVIPAVKDLMGWLNTKLIPALKDMGQWIRDNAQWIVPLVAGVAAYAAVMGTLSIVKTVRGWIAAATAAQWGLNAAMTANPIGLVIAGIAALVAGLVWFFTKTKTGQKIIKAVWGGIKKFIGATVEWFRTTVLPKITAVFDKVGKVFSWLYKNVVKPVFGFIKAYIKAWWTVAKAIFKGVVWFFENVLGPVFEWLWKKVIKPVFRFIGGAIKAFWMLGKGIFKLAIAFIEKVLGPAFRWLYKNVVKPVFGWIGDKISAVWNKGVKPVFRAITGFLKDTLGPTFKWLYRNVVKPVMGWIGDKIGTVWRKGIKPIFQALNKFIRETVPAAFRKGVDLVGELWSKVKAIAAAPIRFVIDTVINKGIIGAFNWVAEKLGVDTLPDVAMPAGLRKGGGGGGSQGKSGGPTRFFAKGGYASPGLAVVGEEGPELVDFHRPGRVYTAAQSHKMGAAALGPNGGGFAPIWGGFQSSIRSAKELNVGAGAGSAWQIPQAAAAWDRLAGLRVRAGSGYPQANTSVGALDPSILAWATGAGNITFNNRGLAPGFSRQGKLATAIHEIGHVLGLPHTSGPSIMQPTIGKYMQPTSYDKSRLSSLYGKGSREPGGAGFDPLGWLAGKAMGALKGLFDKIPGMGMFVDLAKGVGEKLFDGVTDWFSNRGNAAMPELHDQGGKVGTGRTLIENRTRKPEALLNAAQWNTAHRSIKAVERQAAMPDVYVQNPFTGEYLLAKVSTVAVDATGNAMNAADSRMRSGGKYVGGLL